VRYGSIAWKHFDSIKGMYISNPNMPKARANAVKLVRSGWGVRKTARYMGVSPGTITKWCTRAPSDLRYGIPTRSSQPHHSPMSISEDIKWAIIKERLKLNRCSVVVHKSLENKGIKVSLSTVHRVLDRNGYLKKRSKRKRFHKSTERPPVFNPGDLVEIDTIHLLTDPYKRSREKIYVYTLIDIFSRWTYAKAYHKSNTHNSLHFTKEAMRIAPFKFRCVQSDNGSEYSKHFTLNLGIKHRHTRVRKPNDNAHIERFNRTLQDECIKYPTKNIKLINKWLNSYLTHYNNQRLHMGINLLTPQQKLIKYQSQNQAQLFPRS